MTGRVRVEWLELCLWSSEQVQGLAVDGSLASLSTVRGGWAECTGVVTGRWLEEWTPGSGSSDCFYLPRETGAR